jgi:hypothetical protein
VKLHDNYDFPTRRRSTASYPFQYKFQSFSPPFELLLNKIPGFYAEND